MTTNAINYQSRLSSITNTKLEQTSSSTITDRLYSHVTGHSFFGSSLLKRDLEQIDAYTLHQVIDELFTKLEGQDISCMNSLAEILPLDKLQETVRTEYPNYTDALDTAKKMLYEAKHYLANTGNTPTPSIHARFTKIYHQLLTALESILRAFGIASLFKPSENDFHADMKSQKVMMLLSLFTMLTALLVPIIGAELSAIIIGGTLLFITALSLIYPYFQPMPTYLPKAVNWSDQAQDGLFHTAQGRKEILDDIANTLISSKKVKTHPMLIGKTGVGKTQTVKAFVQALERGDYPELQGKKVFYINTADLINGEGMFESSNSILFKISEAMGRHREDIILIFDEIHLACQDRSTVVIGEQLKTLLDDGPNSFPHVIGITTEEEFYRDIYVNHSAFARRFKRINIENTGPSETQEILYSHYLKESPHTLLDQNALPHLLSKTSGQTQPASSLRILSECIRKANESSLPTHNQLNEKNAKLKSLHQSSLGGSFLPYDKTTFPETRGIEEEILQLKKTLDQEKDALGKIQKSKEILAKAKLEMCKTTLKVAATTANPSQTNSFLLLSHFLIPFLEKSIRQKSSELGVPPAITTELIDSVLQDEEANQEKVREAIAKGKEQLKGRKD